jgi:ribosomal protein S18 acetylase RimI-like enzyme
MGDGSQRARGENMYIFDISVDHLDQRKGVGSALLKFGTDRCDAHQCYTWVHSSMARYPAFRKSGFREIGRLEVDLNDYANGVKWVNFEGRERGLGDIHFRHIKYEPKHRV